MFWILVALIPSLLGSTHADINFCLDQSGDTITCYPPYNSYCKKILTGKGGFVIMCSDTCSETTAVSCCESDGCSFSSSGISVGIIILIIGICVIIGGCISSVLVYFYIVGTRNRKRLIQAGQQPAGKYWFNNIWVRVKRAKPHNFTEVLRQDDEYCSTSSPPRVTVTSLDTGLLNKSLSNKLPSYNEALEKQNRLNQAFVIE